MTLSTTSLPSTAARASAARCTPAISSASDRVEAAHRGAGGHELRGEDAPGLAEAEQGDGERRHLREAYLSRGPRTVRGFRCTPRGYGAGGSQPPEVHMLRRVRVLVVLASLAGALSVGAAGASAANWAGLGDSYAAGPLIPNQQLNPLGCLRSDHNFAHLAAAALGRSLADASCSGAKTADMTAPQDVTPGPANPPQLNALTTDTQIVTLQIGGNDIGFTSILRELRHRQPVRAPVPRQVRRQRPRHARRQDRRHRAEGRRGPPGDPHALARARASSSSTTRRSCPRPAAAAGRRSRSRSPTSPTCAASRRTSTRCSPSRRPPTARGSSTTTRASIGRDACKSSSTRWVEPLVPANAAAPFHPNARGEAGIATVVVGAVSS